jgi:hypothetical protein
MSAGNQLVAMFQMDCNAAVLQATSNFLSGGFQVVKSFDLRSTMSASSLCENNQGACQMVVLMVYTQESSPATLVFESCGAETKVSLVVGPKHFNHLAWIHKMLPVIQTDRLDDSIISSLGE